MCREFPRLVSYIVDRGRPVNTEHRTQASKQAKQSENPPRLAAPSPEKKQMNRDRTRTDSFTDVPDQRKTRIAGISNGRTRSHEIALPAAATVTRAEGAAAAAAGIGDLTMVQGQGRDREGGQGAGGGVEEEGGGGVEVEACLVAGAGRRGVEAGVEGEVEVDHFQMFRKILLWICSVVLRARYMPRGACKHAHALKATFCCWREQG